MSMATIAEQLTELQTVKAGLKSALTAGGADMSGASFADYPEKVQAVSDRYRALIDGTASEIDLTGFKVLREYGFTKCTNLTKVILPDDPDFTRLNTGLFMYCYNLKEVSDIPDSVTYLGNGCFGSCYALTRLVVGTGAGSSLGIGHGAFQLGDTDHPATLIMKSAVPGVINTDSIGEYVSRIVVPYAGVADYPNATNWAAYAGKFEARLALRWEDNRLWVDHDILDGDVSSYLYRAQRESISADDGYRVYYYANEGVTLGEECPDPNGGYVMFENNPDAKGVSA